MAMLRANKLLPIILVLLVLIVIVVVIRAKGGGTPGNGQMATVPQTAAPDADSPAETVKSVAATVQDVQKQNQVLVQQNRELLGQKTQIENQIRTEVEAARKKEQEENKAFIEGLKSKIDDLSGRVTTLSATRNGQKGDSTTYAVNGGSGDIPAGLGYDDDSITLSDKVVWIEPLGAAAAGSEGPGMLRKVSNTAKAGAHGAGRLLNSGVTGIGDLSGEVKDRINAAGAPDIGGSGGKLQRRFTVNRNATLMQATAWTALIGRVPVKGTVSDPMPFKVLVGAKNLAANGLELPPELEGMVFSGYAVGDFTLRCSSGRLDSVTYVFTDGTIRTESADGTGGNNSLGYISDRQGIPCVSGELITNAPTYLTQRVGVMALETAGSAYAAKELTTEQNPLGGSSTNLTGDVGKFVWGKSVAGGASEIRKWLDERQQQSFDAIFVPPGIELALHLTKELHIDYDPEGRKLRHDDIATSNGQTAHLD